jgi:FkbH-like protein
MIDDSEFEREEVKASLPAIRVYSNTEIAALGRYKEFDLPVTSVSKTRRSLYQKDLERKKLKEHFEGSYDDFLRECRMNVKVFLPTQTDDIIRCHELIQRSNQLNLSLNRYSYSEFQLLLTNASILSLAIQSEDRFGNYGIVGFCSVSFVDEKAILLDFVLSCRVAQKKIELVFFKELLLFLSKTGYHKVAVRFVPNTRNTLMHRFFEDIQLLSDPIIGQAYNLTISSSNFDILSDIMTIELNIPVRFNR